MQGLFGNGLEARIDDYVPEILIEDETDFLEACEDNNYVANRLERWDPELTDILENGIFVNAPTLLQAQSAQDVVNMKFFIYHALLSYGSHDRGIGKHAYLNHPVKAASKRVSKYENREPTAPISEVVGILLYHDVPEEGGQQVLDQKYTQLQDEVQGALSVHERRILAFFENVGKDLWKLRLPKHAGDVEAYVKIFGRSVYKPKKGTRRVIRKNFSRKLYGANLRMRDLGAYFKLLPKYVTYLREKVDTVEDMSIRWAAADFEKELLAGLQQVSPDNALSLTNSVFKGTMQLTRTSSTLYTIACHLPSDSDRMNKACDRGANMDDIDRAGRIKGINYFSFEPGRYANLYDLLAGSLGIKKTIKEILRNRNLAQILEVSPEEQVSREIQLFDKALYKITADNRVIERAERIRQKRDTKKERLDTPTRIYQLGKQITSVSIQKWSYEQEGRELPWDLKQEFEEDLIVTREAARAIVEGVFSNHCHSGGYLPTAEARRIFHMVQEYDDYDRLTPSKTGLTDKNGRINSFSLDGFMEDTILQRMQGIKAMTNRLLRMRKDHVLGNSLVFYVLAQKHLDPMFNIAGLSPLIEVSK